MAISDGRIKAYTQRLLLSRIRILCNHGFYGMLLMHMLYAVDESVETACTDGVRIIFGTKFLDELDDGELDFVMMHEIMHVVLQHCLRGERLDGEAFNIACDIVVNSNILYENGMDKGSITLKKYGESMHIAPNGNEGFEYTAEEVYKMLPERLKKPKKPDSSLSSDNERKKVGAGDGDGKNGGKATSGKASGAARKKESCGATGGVWDDHSRWGSYTEEELEELRELWVKRFENAVEAISVRDPSDTRGLMPLFAKRILKELRRSQTDWRVLLNDFVEEQIADYSFSPPDKRFEGGDFYLPDFNEPTDEVRDILFMIDTSGSVCDDMMTQAYSEIKGAIDQYGGRLCGWLGFFDAAIIEPEPFSDEEELRLIRPAGGGGTDFAIIFEYVKRFMDPLPRSIVILTDGEAPFPKESSSMGIPVLWIITNGDITPPWGKVARIEV